MGQEETVDNTETQEDNTANNEKDNSKCEYVRNKMEVMQKRIDELKEKVKNEGELLHNEASYKLDFSDEKFQESLNNLQSTFDQHSNENESSSDKSLYYSASNYSLCSLSTSSTESAAYSNFTKFVNNFVKNQNQKERLSLLQLHSKKQISLNMMRHSLMELDSRCAEELELVERSLQHLNRLAAEFNVNAQNNDSHAEGAPKALEFYNSDSVENKKLQLRSTPVFIWPLEERKLKRDYNIVFLKHVENNSIENE